MSSFEITGQLVDLHQQRIRPACIRVEAGRIASIESRPPANSKGPFLLPGFVDSHVHIESSLLVPAAFASLAVVHGTVATVSDPHEIANVCGMEGVEFMIQNGRQVPFKFHFCAPSCVPASAFETAGARLGVAEVAALLARKEIVGLGEIMNYPGVLLQDPEVMAKIAAARRAGKVIDGHAPGLRGEEARKYIESGREGEVTISTDHECFMLAEAEEKIRHGMKIIIREGSAACNFDALIPLMEKHADRIMFGSDDKHPDNLLEGHINQLCARAVAGGHDLFSVLRAACLNPVRHYLLDVGLLRAGDPADFILVEDLQSFRVTQTYINGELAAENGRSLIAYKGTTVINQFRRSPLRTADLHWKAGAEGAACDVIEARDGQLVTGRISAQPLVRDDGIISDPERDLLKIAVVNRYHEAPVAMALIRNFGLRRGAIASSVAHDSHNIIAVGADDESLCEAINLIIGENGGLSAVDGIGQHILPLPVAGLMSDRSGPEVAAAYARLDQAAKALGSPLRSPFMTLSFMALLVIPELKLSDQGLFDGSRFELVCGGL
jgi:adenine deaminase